MTTRAARTNTLRLLARISLMPGTTDEPDAELSAFDFDEASETIEADPDLSDDDRAAMLAMIERLDIAYFE